MNKKEQMESLMNVIIRRFVNDIGRKNGIQDDRFSTREFSELYIANIHMAYRDYIKTLSKRLL